MRAAVWCAVVVAAALLVDGRRAESVPLPKFGEPSSCEETCRVESERYAAECDARSMQEGDRALCHEAARARRDVCLRICDD